MLHVNLCMQLSTYFLWIRVYALNTFVEINLKKTIYRYELEYFANRWAVSYFNSKRDYVKQRRKTHCFVEICF